MWRRLRGSKKVFTDFADTTGLGGVSHLTIAKCCIQLFFWILACLAGTAILAVHTWLIVTDYLQFKTVTSVAVINNRTLLFPQVTFCSLNPVKRSHLRSSENEFFKSLLQEEEFARSYDGVLGLSDALAKYKKAFYDTDPQVIIEDGTSIENNAPEPDDLKDVTTSAPQIPEAPVPMETTGLPSVEITTLGSVISSSSHDLSTSAIEESTTMESSEPPTTTVAPETTLLTTTTTATTTIVPSSSTERVTPEAVTSTTIGVPLNGVTIPEVTVPLSKDLPGLSGTPPETAIPPPFAFSEIPISSVPSTISPSGINFPMTKMFSKSPKAKSSTSTLSLTTTDTPLETSTESTSSTSDITSTESTSSTSDITSTESTSSTSEITSTESTSSTTEITSTESTSSTTEITSTESTSSTSEITSTESTSSTSEITSTSSASSSSSSSSSTTTSSTFSSSSLTSSTLSSSTSSSYSSTISTSSSPSTSSSSTFPTTTASTSSTESTSTSLETSSTSTSSLKGSTTVSSTRTTWVSTTLSTSFPTTSSTPQTTSISSSTMLSSSSSLSPSFSTSSLSTSTTVETTTTTASTISSPSTSITTAPVIDLGLGEVVEEVVDGLGGLLGRKKRRAVWDSKTNDYKDFLQGVPQSRKNSFYSYDNDFTDYNVDVEEILNYYDYGPPKAFNGILKKSGVMDFSDLRKFVRFEKRALRHDFGFHKDDLLLDCSYDAVEDCTEAKFLTTTSRTYGYCYSYNTPFMTEGNGVVRDNSTRQKKSRSFGSEYGLRMSFDIHKDEYFGLLAQGYGIRIHLSEYGTLSNPEDFGFYIPAGKISDVAIRLREYERLRAPYRSNCISEYPEDLKPFISIPDGPYTRESCTSACRYAYVAKLCNCTDNLNLKQPQVKLKRCDITEGMEVLTENGSSESSPRQYEREKMLVVDCLKWIGERLALDTEHPKHLSCDDCQPECHGVEYQRSVSQIDWPNDPFSNIMRVRQSWAERRNRSDFKDSIARVHIYFETDSFELIQETEAKLLYEVIADWGGIAGLYMGVSLITMLEIVELLSLLLIHFCCGGRASSSCCRPIEEGAEKLARKPPYVGTVYGAAPMQLHFARRNTRPSSAAILQL